jgi:hypothetical protein
MAPQGGAGADGAAIAARSASHHGGRKLMRAQP